jgi:hypothetical protein
VSSLSQEILITTVSFLITLGLIGGAQALYHRFRK